MTKTGPKKTTYYPMNIIQTFEPTEIKKKPILVNPLLSQIFQPSFIKVLSTPLENSP